jgi:hypothetical protein
MSDESSRQVQPVAELRRAVTGSSITFLSSRPLLRSVFGVAGAILFIIGVIAAPFWNVPVLAWLNAGQIAATCLAGGLGALGVWYVSGRAGVNTSSRAVAATQQVDLVGQLERLKGLHDSADLTDDEFKRAKARLLD